MRTCHELEEIYANFPEYNRYYWFFDFVNSSFFGSVKFKFVFYFRFLNWLIKNNSWEAKMKKKWLSLLKIDINAKKHCINANIQPYIFVT